jgi:hypothetical protein
MDRLAVVVGDHLRHSQPLPHHHSAQPHGRGSGVGTLKLPHFSGPLMRSPDWGISITKSSWCSS